MEEIKKSEKDLLSWAEETVSDKNDGNAPDLDWQVDLKDLNLELEERILAANKDSTKVKWSKLLPDLMGADILMIGKLSDQPDANGNRPMNILMMQKDGHVVIPFFTNPERIRSMAHPENSTFDVMKVNTVRFFQSIKGKPCVLNPMSEYARIFTPFEMKVLAAENEHLAPLLPVQK